jgi:hypothetical protein
MTEALAVPVEVRPPQASRAGRNRYYHECKKVGAKRHYGICLFTIEAFERGQKLNEEPCVKAIRSKTCPALKMRQEELDAGQSIYYAEPDPSKAVNPDAARRERHSVSVNHNSSSYRRGFAGVTPKVTSAPTQATAAKPKPKAKPASPLAPGEMIEFDTSKMVNALINDAPTEQSLKDQMLALGRPAAARRRKAVTEGKKLKASVFDYMTAAELKAMSQLKRQLVSLKMEAQL